MLKSACNEFDVYATVYALTASGTHLSETFLRDIDTANPLTGRRLVAAAVAVNDGKNGKLKTSAELANTLTILSGK